MIWGVEGCGNRPAVDFTVDFRLRISLRGKDKKIDQVPLHFRSATPPPQAHHAPITYLSDDETHEKIRRMPTRLTRQQQQLDSR